MFRAWQEDWEAPLLKDRRCPVVPEAKLMLKYGDLTMIHLDLDSEQNGRELYIKPNKAHWRLYSGGGV